MGFAALILDSVVLLVVSNIILRSLGICHVCLPYSLVLTVFVASALYL